MSAPLPTPGAIATDERDQFIVSHGKSGVIGVFTLTEPHEIRRGMRVVVQSPRGIEIGDVLGPASLQQARLFGATSAGLLLRALSKEDDARLNELNSRAQQIFELVADLSRAQGIQVDVLDVDLYFDGSNAIVQFVGDSEGIDRLGALLEDRLTLTVRFENVAQPSEKEEHHCDKPDCGRNAGGCSTCATGGGCSTCGSSKVDLREYFGHLRTKMEKRIPLT